MDISCGSQLSTDGNKVFKSQTETVSIDFSALALTTEIDDAQKENLQMLYDLINRLEDIEKPLSCFGLTSIPTTR